MFFADIFCFYIHFQLCVKFVKYSTNYKTARDIKILLEIPRYTLFPIAGIWLCDIKWKSWKKVNNGPLRVRRTFLFSQLTFNAARHPFRTDVIQFSALDPSLPTEPPYCPAAVEKRCPRKQFVFTSIPSQYRAGKNTCNTYTKITSP
jgi:hypothetical protein